MINFPIILASALIPLVVGFVWYNPKVLGTAWMKVADMNEEKMQGANMALIFGVTYLLSVFLGVALNFMVIHQFHVGSILMNEPGFGDPNSEIGQYFAAFMENYGNNFRTFKHGALHGTIGAITLALPVLGINALFERKGFKYIALNTGYWIVSFAIMGGIICAFA